MGREVDEGGIETLAEGPAPGTTCGDVVADTESLLDTDGPTPHLAATGPVSSGAGTRQCFGRLGTVASVDFRFVPLI